MFVEVGIMLRVLLLAYIGVMFHELLRNNVLLKQYI
jgi:hypothetical protein